MKFFLITCLFSFIGFNGVAQKAIKKYFFKNHHDTIGITIENGKIVKSHSIGYMPSRNVLRIKVKNVNPFLYNINMKELQNDYLNEMKDATQTLLDYKIGSLSLSLPEIGSKNFAVLQTDDNTVVSSVEQISEKIASIQQYINMVYYKKINVFQNLIKTTQSPEYQDSINKYDYHIADSITKRDELKARLIGVTARSSSSGDNRNIINLGIQKSFVIEIGEYNDEILQLQKLFHFYQALKAQVYSTGVGVEELEKTKIQLAGIYFSDLPYNFDINALSSKDMTYFFHEKLTRANKIYQRMQGIYSDFVSRKGNVPSENQLALTMGNYLEWLTEERKKLTLNALDNIITTTVLLYNAITQENFEYNFTIDDIKEKTDFVKYIFDASPKASFQSAIIPKPIRYEVTMPIKGGIQMNVSSGFFFNFGIEDEEFYYRPDGDTSFVITKADKSLRSTFLPSIGLMLHIYERTFRAFKPAVSVGFSTTNATDIKYYLGASAVFGKNQRWVLSAGFAGAEKQILKAGFGEGNGLIVSSSFKDNNAAVETTKKFKIGSFVSFTFNLFGSTTKKFDFESIGGGNSGQ